MIFKDKTSIPVVARNSAFVFLREDVTETISTSIKKNHCYASSDLLNICIIVHMQSSRQSPFLCMVIIVPLYLILRKSNTDIKVL